MDSKTRSSGQQKGVEKVKSITQIQISPVMEQPRVDMSVSVGTLLFSHCLLKSGEQAPC